jgi:hypothetical protein
MFLVLFIMKIFYQKWVVYYTKDNVLHTSDIPRTLLFRRGPVDGNRISSNLKGLSRMRSETFQYQRVFKMS